MNVTPQLSLATLPAGVLSEESLAKLQAVLPTMSPEEKLEVLQLLERGDLATRRNRLRYYKPYPKQAEFHAAGGNPSVRERLLMAANQVGKTAAAAAEYAMHLTGRYPEGWRGKRYPYAIRMLAGSESADLVRKGVQTLLLGPAKLKDQWGTGFIPYDALRATSPWPGVSDTVRSITVRHVSGEDSVLELLSYDQGRTKWQADTVHEVWFDEEPPLDLYSEGLVRTQATHGGVTLTFTPLLGISSVVKRFLVEKLGGTSVTSMTIYDALHYTPEEREAILAGYPEHERETRGMGVPMAGAGRVFSYAESGVKIEPFLIPAHWPRLVALDFGWGHPAAAVWLAYDEATDTVYVYDCWRASQTTVPLQAMLIRQRGAWIPVAWPHDGLQHDKGSGVQLAQQYKDQQVAMLPTHATWPDGTWGFEAGISVMQTRFQARQLRVFATCTEWFEEFRTYHRKMTDGVGSQVVKLDDDLMAATRIGIMSLRHAKTEVMVRGFALSAVPTSIERPMILDPVTGY